MRDKKTPHSEYRVLCDPGLFSVGKLSGECGPSVNTRARGTLCVPRDPEGSEMVAERGFPQALPKIFLFANPGYLWFCMPYGSVGSCDVTWSLRNIRVLSGC